MSEFRGGRPLTEEDTAFFRAHHQAVNEAITRAARERSEKIAARIRELGYDPENPQGIPELLLRHIYKEAELGIFETPVHVITDQEES